MPKIKLNLMQNINPKSISIQINHKTLNISNYIALKKEIGH